MIDKRNSDDEFSDEGFDDEFSFDEDSDTDHSDLAEAPPPKKTTGFSPSSFSLKRIMINVLMTVILIACTFSVYQFWSKSRSKAASQKTSKTTQDTAQKMLEKTKKPEAGSFSESDLAAVSKEGDKAQKGVFVYKSTTETKTPSETKVTTETTTTTASTTPSSATTLAKQAASLTKATAEIINAPEVKTPETAESTGEIKTETKIATGAEGAETKSEAEKALEVIEANTSLPTSADIAALQKMKPVQKPEQEPEHEIEPLVISQPTPQVVVPNMTTTSSVTPAAMTASSTPLGAGVSTGPSAAEVHEMTTQINKTLDALSKLNHQMEGNLNQVKYLDAYTREVSLNVEKLNNQVSAMDNRIQSLSNLANSLSKDLGKVRNEVGYAKRVAGEERDKENLDLLAPPRRKGDNLMVLDEGGDCSGGYAAPRKPARCIGPEEPEFVVHAVIPGRAWLKSCKGHIVTVTEGETVGNYGKVLVIDAANSIVLTSSGIAFR